MITLEALQEMFADTKSRTTWDLEGEMLWGYFFTDSDRRKLQPAADYLTNAGYKFVDIFPSDENDRRIYFLHVERIERHTPETLDQRNQYFYALAAKFGLDSYDGMDVGPIEG